MAGRTVLVLTVLPLLCISGVISGLVKKCESNDSKCMKEVTQGLIPVFANGLKEYQVKRLDPLSFKQVDASSPNLKLFLTDFTVTGLKDCIAKKIQRDKSKNKLFVKIQCSCQLESQYEMEGQILIIPIKGKGPVHITLRKIEIRFESDMGEIEKGGVLYWDIKDWKHSFTLKDKSDVNFENLFEGNEVLAQAAREVISSNGNDVIYEIGASTIKKIVKEVVDNVNNFFHSVPAQELSID